MNLRRPRHYRDPALALDLSCSFALGVPQFDNLTFALSSLISRQQKKCSIFEFQFVSNCSGYFSCFFLFSLFVVGFLVSSCSRFFWAVA